MKDALATVLVLIFLAVLAPVFFTVLAHPEWCLLMLLPLGLVYIFRVIYFAATTDWSRNGKKQ